MGISDESVEKAVREQLAASVLASITPEYRDEILKASIAKALGGYSVEAKIQAAVARSAEKRVRVLLLPGTPLSKAVDAAVKKGLRRAIAAVPAAMYNAVVNAMRGTASYGRYNSLLGKALAKAAPEQD